MTQYTKIPYTLVLSLLLTLFAGPLKFSLSKADGLVRELWTGEMEQTAPLPWKGRMELYIRYASDEENKHFTGVLSWPDLGEARTIVMGKITGSKIVFVESECVSGACNQIFTGGEYLGHFSANNTLMEGRGQLKRDAPQLIPFHGNFKLKKTATK